MKKLRPFVFLLAVCTLASCQSKNPKPTSSTTPSSSSVVSSTPAPTNPASTPVPSVPTSSSSSSTGPVGPTTSGETPTIPVGPVTGTTTAPVVPPVAGTVKVSGDTACYAGETIQLEVSVTPEGEPVRFTSSKENVATVDSNGLVTAQDVKTESTVTITVELVNDPAVKDTIEITVSPTPGFTAKATLTQLNGTEELPSVVEGTGAYKLTVTSDNLPNGASIADCTFDWPKNNAIASFVKAGDVQDNEIQYVVNFAGTHRFDIKVTCGSDVYVIHKTIEVTRNDALYTTIDTPEKFIETFDVNGSITGRYILGANLDLKGHEFSGATKNNSFNAVLDGDGHTVRNFKVACQANGADGGMFFVISMGIIKNLHLQGKIVNPGGAGGLIAKELQSQSIVSNCLIEAENTMECTDLSSAWTRNGGAFGFIKGTMQDCVVIATSSDDENAKIRDAIFGVAPYAYYNGTDALAKVDNVYTNKSGEYADVLDASGSNQWGMLSAGSEHINIVGGLGDFSTVKVSDLNLDGKIWTLADGQMPKLAHYEDEFVTINPAVSIKASKTSLEPEEEATLTITTKNFDSEPTIEVLVGDDEVVSVTESEGVYTIKALADGETTVQVRATGDCLSNILNIKVKTPDPSGPTYEKPEGAVEIGSAAELKAFITDNANVNKSIYLTSDIDCTDWGMGVNSFGFEGHSYTGIFEGAGHTISNYSSNRSLFHFLGGNCEIRNLTLEAEITQPGFAALAHGINDTEADVKITNVNIILKLGGTNSISGVMLDPISGSITCENVNVLFEISGNGANCFRVIGISNANIHLVGETVTYSVHAVGECTDLFTEGTNIRGNLVDHNNGAKYVPYAESVFGE